MLYKLLNLDTVSGTGSMVAAVSTAAGRDPIILGKDKGKGS